MTEFQENYPLEFSQGLSIINNTLNIQNVKT